MRNPAKRPLSALYILFIVIGSPVAGEPNTIIPEWNASIQLISTGNFNQWPGVSGISPVEVSAVDERTWLIWPETIINLDENGMMDEQTLLTLFTSQTANWGGRRWTPENGLICSDGYWRGFYSDGKTFAQLNLENGNLQTSSWNRPVPDSIYPAYDGNLLSFSGSEAGLIKLPEYEGGQLYKTVKTGNVPLTQVAVSTERPLIAWTDVVDDKLRIADFSGGLQVYSIDKSGLPEQVTWSIAWAGNKLMMAYPGELRVVNLREDGTDDLEKLTDDRLPRRWYRLRGGRSRLIVQSPETGMLGIVREGENYKGFSESSEDHGFSILLAEFALRAGDILEENGDMKSAEKFYAWVLPHVREFRSLLPLELIWPELESELTTRRLNLRSRLN